MNPATPPNRCRLALIAPPMTAPERLLAALEGGDVATVLLPAWDRDADRFQDEIASLVPALQSHGAAVMVEGDARVAMRTGADGLHIESGRSGLAEIIEKNQSKLMIGAGGAKTRDDALQMGELRPDYLFFGRFGYDQTPAPHPRNLTLGGWWSEMVALPCVVMGGSDLETVDAVAATGADFVALSAAIFAGSRDPAQAVAEANARLDAGAPTFEVDG